MSSERIAGHALSWAAGQFRDRPAVVFRDQSFSYTQIERRSNQLANALIGLGRLPGERLAVLLNNSVQSIESQFAAEKAAQAYVALNARHTVREQAAILNDAQASVLIVGPEFRDSVLQVRLQVPTLRVVIGVGWQDASVLDYESLLTRASDRAPRLKVPADLLLRIAYTSGTTGQPKGVAYSIERFEARLANHFAAMEYGLGIDDAMLHVGPLTHAAGVHLLPCYLRGARNIVADRFDAEEVVARIAAERISQLMVVPTMLGRLLEVLAANPGADLSALRRVHYGTAPTPTSMVHEALERLGPILRQQYGMTEAVQPLCVLYPHDHLQDGLPSQRITSCGRPTMDVDITVRDADGQPVAPGEVGEIAIAHRGIGEVAFWRRPDLEREAIRNGWYYSGDLGRFDEEGFLYIVGRNKDMMISGGFNVYAREVEDALHTHPAVAEVAVLGLPDARWGEVVAAFVVRRPGQASDADTLSRHCGELIAGYKKPRVIEFVDALPRNHAGKVTKNDLRDAYLARHPQGDIAK
ncbi:class I adenylate-forming enzyme family protein [Variovorax sp. OV329]|uniref:class I adenylate-forming enzyme family protein n=1 Tax=Variovorax sp. OV329 TaxID=1882825 RepID=UPI0008E0E549|nr:AMP-binding protein [Variovorax sp. OV329]SFN51454.1 Acyl-CoA synthetase (AMP-forming)/AMP-acid ligase II [Variovorax sp. OV329]